jgi:hypothetical protein
VGAGAVEHDPDGSVAGTVAEVVSNALAGERLETGTASAAARPCGLPARAQARAGACF